MANLPFQQLLARNDLAIIENPLRRIPEDRLKEYIQSFYEDSKLACVINLDTLVRGARLAREEEAFISEETAEERLSKVDKAALEKEKSTSIWTESREIKIILLTCAVGSIVQGWVQGAIVGPNQAWPNELLHEIILPSEQTQPGTNLWIFAGTNAVVYFAASTVGALLCDPLTELFVGRRGAIFVAALFTFTASVGEAFCYSWQSLFACRFLLGIGMGAKSSVIPVYESEISPARLRGQILTSWQTGTALGIAISGVIPLIKPESWRFQISSSFIPAFALLLLVFVGSESPRWLIKKQRYCDAYTNLLRLRENPLLAARDLVIIWAQLQVEATLFMRTTDDVFDLENRIPYLDQKVYLREIGLFGYARRITQLFTIPRVRRATLASFFVMTAQQLTGVNVFALLASTLFGYDASIGQHVTVYNKDNTNTDLDVLVPKTGNLWLYFGFGVANFLSSLIAYFYIDRKGRRWLLMSSLAAMFPFLVGTAFAFKVKNPVPQQGLIGLFLVLYTIEVAIGWGTDCDPSIKVYSPGAGTVPFLYSSEIFPQVLREVGMAWASAVCWLGAGVLDLFVPALIYYLTQTGLLCLFAGLDLLALFLVWLFVPGTGRQIATMEEMNYVFGVSTRRHVKYQVKEVAPWCVEHYLKRKKDVNLKPLYRYAWARDEGNVQMNEDTNGNTHEWGNERATERGVELESYH